MKEILYSKEAKDKLKSGAKKLYDAVSVTFGPRGRNVALRSYGAPRVVHDGVTVAQEVELPDKFEDVGARIGRESSSRTNDLVGDATTATVVLYWPIIEEGFKSGANPMIFRKGLDKAVKAVVEEIKGLSHKITTKEEKIQVATISAENPEIGKMVVDAMEKVGEKGVITVDESKGNDIELEFKEGMQFDKGYLSPYFVTNSEKMEAVVDNPYILITDIKLANIQDMVPLLDEFVKVSKNLVIISSEIEGDALATLVFNKLRGVLNVLAVKAPGFGDGKKAQLEDIAVLTGGTFVSEEAGMKLSSVKVENLGRADKVIADKDNTTIVGGKGNTANRIKQIESELEKATSYEKEKLKERLAKLVGGVAVVKVGAPTETELKELKLRVEDAVRNTQAAVEEGIVAGGGITYLKAREAIKKLKLDPEEKIGADILYKALENPIKCLLKNSGAKVNLRNIKGDIGFNVVTMKLVDMIKDGVVDSTKALRVALENAVSSAIMVLTTECIIVEEEKEKDKTQRVGSFEE